MSVIIYLTKIYVTSQYKLFNTQKELIFYKIYTYSQRLLEEILKEYKEKKEIIKQKEKFVIKNLDKNLSYLKSKLGKNYHIFLTDENFIIRKTTFKYDQNFSLAFAKDIFLMHKNKIGISPPICEPATTNFFIFADTYKNKRVIQVGYIISSKTIENIKKTLKEIKASPFVKEINLFFIHPKTKYAQKCQILKPLYRKYTLKEMKELRKEGLLLYKKLQQKNPLILKDKMYILSKDIFNPQGYVIVEVKINNQFLKEKIKNAIITSIIAILIISTITLLILIYITNILNYLKEFAKSIKKEEKFKKKINKELNEIINSYNKTLSKLQNHIKSKENFIHFAMHELATPINILSLYMDEYEELKPAIKKLISSYKNLSFSLKNEKEKFNLKELILQRVEYFKDIVKVEEKKIIYDLSDLWIVANKEEFEILIDNNIKNAIKYSTSKEIYITLKDKILRFKNQGKIKNTSKIFEKFYREEEVKGGFGLGLYIIKTIANKYNIKINLRKENDFIIFEYNLKEINENSNS